MTKIKQNNCMLFRHVFEVYQECRYNTLFFDSATHYIVDFEHVMRELAPIDKKIFLLYYVGNMSKTDVAKKVHKSMISVWRHIRGIEKFIVERMEEKQMFPVSQYFRGYRGLYKIPL